MTALEVAWLTCLTVCDYIDRLHGCSINKAIQIVQSWRGKSPEVCDTSPHHTTPYVRTHTRMFHTHLFACQYRQESLQEFERVGKWPKSANQELFRSHTNGATGFYDRFHLAVAAFMAQRVSLLVSISILILVCILFVNNNFNIVITYYNIFRNVHTHTLCVYIIILGIYTYMGCRFVNHRTKKTSHDWGRHWGEDSTIVGGRHGSHGGTDHLSSDHHL